MRNESALAAGIARAFEHSVGLHRRCLLGANAEQCRPPQLFRLDPQRLRLAADIGGTFTDVAAFDESTRRLLLGKSLSTPRAMVEGIEAGVSKAGTAFKEAGLFLHGSTVAINTMLERTGAKTALVTTRGFRDVYEIGRINRPDAYNLFFQKHVPLVPRAHCYEVTERLFADGRVHKPLNEAELLSVADELEREGIEAVAILFLHCYRNPAHELRAKELLQKRLPKVFISASHELSQEYREFERCSTVVANAFVGPRVQHYLTEIGERITAEGFRGTFLVVQSTGGLFELDKARRECIRILESGPASGVIGTQALCHALGMDNAIAFDMGGTTAKAGVIQDGRALTTGHALIGSYDRALPIQVSTIDIFEVGTGGGSIARVEHGGALHVGPRSAGAEPGPACYGRGGEEPTITDANLILGRLGADRFLGGEMRLDADAAERAMHDKVAEPLGLTITEAAQRHPAYRRDQDVLRGQGCNDRARTRCRQLRAGGLWRCRPAACDRGGARDRHPQGDRPAGAGPFLGLRHAVLGPALRFRPHLVHAAGGVRLRALRGRVFAISKPRAGRRLRHPRLRRNEIAVQRALDMRYVGQEHTVTVDIPQEYFDAQDREAIKALFDAVHAQRYGTSAPAEPAEIASLRTTVTGIVEKPGIERDREGTVSAAGSDGAYRQSQGVLSGNRVSWTRRPSRATNCSPATVFRALR